MNDALPLLSTDFTLAPDDPRDDDRSATTRPTQTDSAAVSPESLQSPEPPTHGCMECKGPREYTVEHFANGNTGWRCVVCEQILRLIPGQYVLEHSDIEASL
jgi:hypothetical protein